MMNIVDINGYRAVISCDLKQGVFRGEFAGLSSRVIFLRRISADCFGRKNRFWTLF